MVHLFFVGGGIKHRDLLLGFPLLYHYLLGCEESLHKKASDTSRATRYAKVYSLVTTPSRPAQSA